MPLACLIMNKQLQLITIKVPTSWGWTLVWNGERWTNDFVRGLKNLWSALKTLNWTQRNFLKHLKLDLVGLGMLTLSISVLLRTSWLFDPTAWGRGHIVVVDATSSVADLLLLLIRLVFILVLFILIVKALILAKFNLAMVKLLLNLENWGTSSFSSSWFSPTLDSSRMLGSRPAAFKWSRRICFESLETKKSSDWFLESCEPQESTTWRHHYQNYQHHHDEQQHC